MSPKQQRKWWKEANAYQIWPASFQDTNNDGCGDIPGIISRLDYLKMLGIDVIWLSPVYDSPQHDMGYDISNYEKIWPQFGTLADMETLIKEAKIRNMRLIMDLVVNHTSNEHEWFRKSSASRDESNPYHDWYHWRDPKGWDSNGEPIPPNNWRAAFGGSVWTYSASRKQFYLHLCLPEQPDLNWFNPKTRQAIYESAIEFWLKRGVDGFRVDVVNFYWKDLSFPDAVITDSDEQYQPMQPQHILNGPLMHTWLQEQRREVLDKYGDVVLVGELPATSTEEILRYISPENRELDMIFDFDLLMGGNRYGSPLHEWKNPKLSELKPSLVKTQGLIRDGKGWPTAFLENHDNVRSIDKFGPGADNKFSLAAAKMLALFVTSLSGTLFVYQGQEIGMTNIPKTWSKKSLRDRAVLRYLEEVERKNPEDAQMNQKAYEAALRLGRDNARTPVQWSSELHGGFTKSTPWIDVNENYKTINAANQEGRNGSVLEFWRSMLKLRKEYKDLFIYGDFELLDETSDKKISFVKTCAETGSQILVDLNFSDQEQPLLDDTKTKNRTRRLLVSTYSHENSEFEKPLQPWEGRAYNLT